MSEIAALGYIGLEVSDLARWAAFAGDMLSLEVLTRGDTRPPLPGATHSSARQNQRRCHDRE